MSKSVMYNAALKVNAEYAAAGKHFITLERDLPVLAGSLLLSKVFPYAPGSCSPAWVRPAAQMWG